MTLVQALILFACYLSGSIPFGYLLTRKATGLNILEQGSKNIGSTNVGRIAGKRVATYVQLLDMAKGLVPVGLLLVSAEKGLVNAPEYFVYLAALLTIIGHDFPVFLMFRGGKGVNTTLGATILLAPLSVLVSVMVYFVVKRRFGYVSAGSMSLALTLLVSTLIFYRGDHYLIFYTVVCSTLILLRHIPNLKRLMAGRELH